VTSDAVPYLRKRWTLGWIAMCPKHECVLVTGCAICGHNSLIIPTLRSKNNLLKRRLSPECDVCRAQYPQHPAHELALDLQARLLIGRESGSVNLPHWVPLGWATAISLIDLLLAVIWVASIPDLRQSFYRGIEQSLGLSRRIGLESYDGLLLAAWLLDEWPARLRGAMAELQVQRLPWRIGRGPMLSPVAEGALRNLLDQECFDAEMHPETSQHRGELAVDTNAD